jgi:hypothetical protein
MSIFLVPFDGREVVLEKSREARWKVIGLKETREYYRVARVLVIAYWNGPVQIIPSSLISTHKIQTGSPKGLCAYLFLVGYVCAFFYLNIYFMFDNN